MYLKRLYLIYVILGILLLTNNNIFAQTPYKIRRVVIDAGHGGKDPGAIGKNSKEKDIALNVALMVGEYIKTNFKDIEVIYTRSSDVFIELFERAKIANEKKADLFISIHCNSAESTKPFGTETWVMGIAKSQANLRVAQKENAVILQEGNYQKNYDNFDPNSPESYIIFSLFQSAYRDQSIAFATKVQNQFTNNLQRHDRGVKEAGLLVLWRTTMPSVLVELGFISNPEEEKFLSSKEGQEKLAKSILKAFKEYKADMEKDEKANTEIIELQDTIAQSKFSIEKKDSLKKSIQAGVSDSNEIIFGVQFSISNTKKPSNSESFNGVTEVWSYTHDGMYKYVSGRETSLDLAVNRMQAIREKGFKEAFVVAFINGKRISPTEAVKILNEKKTQLNQPKP